MKKNCSGQLVGPVGLLKCYVFCGFRVLDFAFGVFGALGSWGGSLWKGPEGLQARTSLDVPESL